MIQKLLPPGQMLAAGKRNLCRCQVKQLPLPAANQRKEKSGSKTRLSPTKVWVSHSWINCFYFKIIDRHIEVVEASQQTQSPWSTILNVIESTNSDFKKFQVGAYCCIYIPTLWGLPKGKRGYYQSPDLPVPSFCRAAQVVIHPQT